MNAQRFVIVCCVLGFASLFALTSSRVSAQFLAEQNAAMGMNDAMSGGSATGGLNTNLYTGRAQNAAGIANGYNAQFGNMGAPGGMPVDPNDPNAMAPIQPGGTMTPQQAQALAVRANVKKITVITGQRVFDAVTGELVDDAQRKQVPETEKTKYFDDGTHGDLVENDGIYTNVDENHRRDSIGASNQKVKEQLVQALRVADSYSPVEFYGFSLMSTDRAEPLPRNEAWKVVKDPEGIGYILKEEPVATPLSVPKFRDKLKEKDRTVKEDWSFRFLQEYRKKKDDLQSEFFPVYIPLPPQAPSVMPPVSWTPFSDPSSELRAQAQRNPLTRGGAGPMGAMMGAGGGGGVPMGGMPMGGGMMGR